MRGRKPKPTALHKIQGTFRPDRHAAGGVPGVPVAEGALGKPPVDMAPGQKKIWRHAIAHAPAGVLRKIDRDIMVCWCETVDRRNRAQQLLEAERLADLWLYSPAHRIVDRMTALLVRLVGELGFSPVSRARIRIGSSPPAAPDPSDPWAMLRLIPGGKSPDAKSSD